MSILAIEIRFVNSYHYEKRIKWVNFFFSCALDETHTAGKLLTSHDGNNVVIGPPFGTSSDSESPTEPVSQQTVQMLRARIVPNKQ